MNGAASSNQAIVPEKLPAESPSSAYEAQLRAMPSYELKAEYIVLFGKTWDQLERPRLENAIRAMVRRHLEPR